VLVIKLWGEKGAGFIFGNGNGPVVPAPVLTDMWYFRQLHEPTVITRLSAWLPFSLYWIAIAHQKRRPDYWREFFGVRPQQDAELRP
jgi:hypothetical protein